jgi:hypothetical protein
MKKENGTKFGMPFLALVNKAKISAMVTRGSFITKDQRKALCEF